jgi:hypothetical protein
VAAAATSAVAHTGGSTGYASIAIDRGGIRYSLTLWPAALPPAVAEEIQRARAGDVISRDRLLGSIRDKVALTAQGRRCQAGPGSVLPSTPSVESLTLVVDFTCADPVHDLAIRDDLVDAFGTDYHTLARIAAPDGVRQFAFTPETRETRIRLNGAAGAAHGGLASFVLLGIEHILSGWDHLLFLLALLLPGGGVLALAKIITAFTLAHSVTLALAVLNAIALPERLVEAVIALSIAAVAAENLYLRPTVTRRWIASFCFGLVHGLGFSSALRELDLPARGLWLSLFGFNAGVELGQALVVAAALPLLLALRRTGGEQRVIRGSSVAILLVGLVLFVERALR